MTKYTKLIRFHDITKEELVMSANKLSIEQRKKINVHDMIEIAVIQYLKELNK